MGAPKPLNTQAWMPIKKLALPAVGNLTIKAVDTLPGRVNCPRTDRDRDLAAYSQAM
jgi:hypothetical protein